MIVHGGAIGADTLAGRIARSYGFAVEVYQAAWLGHGRSAGMKRNLQMLDTKPALVVAFHDSLPESKGTAHCVDEARNRGIPVEHIFHKS